MLADSQNQSTDVKPQMPNPWAQQFAPYLRNFHGPMYQQMSPYQGYGFTGMQVPPPYYPVNMPWPSHINGSADHESHDHPDRRSSSRTKGKPSNVRVFEKDDLEECTGSSESNSETNPSTEKSHKKKHGKKSARKVVIRNINYITSKRDGEKDGSSETDLSVDNEYLNGDSLKHQLEEKVGSFPKHKKLSSRHKKHNGSNPIDSDNDDQDNDGAAVKNKNGDKGSENWDALQQLFLREESNPESHSMSVEAKYFGTERSNEKNSSAFKPEVEGRTNHKPIATDAFLVTEKGAGEDGKISSVQGFDPNENGRSVIKRGGTPEEFLLTHRNEESEGYTRMSRSDDAALSSVTRSQTSDDWFVGKQSDGAASRGGNNHLGFIERDYGRFSADQFEKKSKDVIIDDSLMIQGLLTDDHPESQLTTDISLVSDIFEATLIENGIEVSQQKSESVGFYEPDELYMVRDYDAGVEQTLPTWNPELDYENYNSVNDFAKNLDVDACEESKVASNEKSSDKKSGNPPSRDPRSRTLGGPLRRAKPEPTPGTRRSTFGSKTTDSKSLLEKVFFYLTEL